MVEKEKLEELLRFKNEAFTTLDYCYRKVLNNPCDNRCYEAMKESGRTSDLAILDYYKNLDLYNKKW